MVKKSFKDFNDINEKKDRNKFLIKTIIFYIDLLMLIYDLKGNLKTLKRKVKNNPTYFLIKISIRLFMEIRNQITRVLI